MRVAEGAVDSVGKWLVAMARRWSRAGERGGNGISVRSAQRWLQLRATEVAIETTLEEKGRWWPAIGVGEEEGATLMAVVVGGGEEKGDGKGCGQEGYCR
ncbi:hypothetical protein BHM03_00021722 [Ensete ventricosum]|nr:hypothetical protein BHM03_00021722 [Ensete ventricosum]